MRDPYLYEDFDVLRNLANIRDSDELKKVEGDITRYTMTLVYSHEFIKFDVDTLCEFHRIIFDSLYDWAGEFRTIPVIKREEILGGDTVRYAHPKNIVKELKEACSEVKKLKKSESKKDLVFKLVRIASKIWQTHPFRDGNTRAIMSFIALLAEHLRIELDYSLFEKHAFYVRNSLVWASQGIYSKYEYLEHIFFDASGIIQNLTEIKPEVQYDYTHIGGYNVVEYKEQPHIYIENNQD